MKHAFREQETPNADPDRLRQNTHIGARSVAEGMAAFNAALPAKYRKDAVLAIEYLVTSSPEDMASKTREQQDQYFTDALEWLRRKHGSDQVIYAGIHRDEKTPHMYAYVVPIDPDTGGLNAKKWLGGAKALNEMQTDFAEQVGAHHGLQRGIEGSRARHTTVSQFYAAIQAQEHRHGRFSAEQLEPMVLEKRLFGRTVVESPVMVAKRLTKTIHEHYDPAIKQASVASLERRRATEMANTARDMSLALKRAQERLRGFEGMFEGLSKADQRLLEKQAAQIKRKREIAAEKRRRVDALPQLLTRSAGAALTFVEKALDAIREQEGDWKRVNWEAVEQASIREAVQQNRQTLSDAVQAVLERSPGQADKNPEEIRLMLDQVAQEDATSSPKPHRPSGYSL